MSSLLTLSPEILKQIFSASDTVQDALNAATTSQYLRAVWLEHSDLIIEDILKPLIPAYAEAINLAITETRLSLSLEADPPLRNCLGRLLHNVDLCASACTAYAGAHKDDPLPEASFYPMRRIGLGLNHLNFRENLYSELRSATRGKLLLLARLSHWMFNKASFAEQVRQGVESEDYDWRLGDLNNHEDVPWSYADYAVGAAICDIDLGTNNLLTAIQGQGY